MNTPSLLESRELRYTKVIHNNNDDKNIGLMQESGYVTEVHHINGEGEDAGVVYCEMQARENTGESLTHLNMLRAMYPGHCGYKSETGGIMANLRNSTSHEKVTS